MQMGSREQYKKASNLNVLLLGKMRSTGCKSNCLQAKSSIITTKPTNKDEILDISANKNITR